MHENREISWTSWVTNQDRSAKAINRNADVNAQEKSDCAVVPLNRPNKEGNLPRRRGREGRRQRRTSFDHTCLRLDHPARAIELDDIEGRLAELERTAALEGKEESR